VLVDVLLVEDDAQLAELLTRVFREEGHVVTTCGTIREAEDALSRATFDVAVIDWMLPDGDGLDLCSRLQTRRPAIPALMLTARGEVQDRVAGLRSGADDYLTKPFDVAELLARVDVIHRRATQHFTVRVGALEVDRRAHVARINGKRLELTTREFAVLARLADVPDVCVSRQTLLSDVWRMAFDPGSGVIDVQMSRLRDELGDAAWMIETVRGQGFRLRTTR
jgi:DNA-binding response OmpR family regulator